MSAASLEDPPHTPRTPDVNVGPLLVQTTCELLSGRRPTKEHMEEVNIDIRGGGGRLPANLVVKFQHMFTCKLLSVTSPHNNVEGVACRPMGARP